MRGALAELPERIPIGRIDQLWLFPPRRIGGRENGLVVLSLFSEDESASTRRQVFTLRYEEAEGAAAYRSDALEEQGSAPMDRIPDVIAGVLGRLGEEEMPRLEPIRGDPRRWDALFADSGEGALDRSYGE